MRKKIFGFVLVVAMVVPLFAGMTVTVSAADDIELPEDSETTATWFTGAPGLSDGDIATGYNTGATTTLEDAFAGATDDPEQVTYVRLNESIGGWGDLELAEALGCKTLKIGLDMDKKSTLISLANSYDIIFNTVPSWIFDGAFFEKLSPETVLAELASAPGGFDLAALQGSDAKIISLQGIPGKYAPVSAGRLIFESIEKIFEKEKTL